MASPLAHIKVVAVGVAMTGPHRAMMLGDDGREPPLHGSMSRDLASANRDGRRIADVRGAIDGGCDGSDGRTS